MRNFFRFFAWLSLALVAACSGGGSSNNSPGGGVTTSSVTGFLVNGAPVGGSTITIRDVNGDVRTGTTSCNGSFTIDVTGMVPPLLAQANFSDFYGIQRTFYSYGAAGTLNINPITTAAVSAANGTATVSFNVASQMALRSNLPATVATLRDKLAGILSLYGAAGADPFTDPHTNGCPLDNFFQIVALDVAGATLTVRNTFDNSVIATAPLANLQSLTMNPDAVAVLDNNHIHITSISATGGPAGGHFILTGSGFDPDPAKNYVMVGGLPASASVIANGAGTPVGLDVNIPITCYVGQVRIVVINRHATGFPEMGEAPSTFTVFQGYDYVISSARIDVGLIKVTGSFTAGEIVTATVLQDTSTFNFRVAAGPSSIVLPLPLKLDPARSFAITVTSGIKSSNTFVATP